MKRTLLYVLVCLFVLFSGFGLVACSNKDTVKDYSKQIDNLSSNVGDVKKGLSDIEKELDNIDESIELLKSNPIEYDTIALTLDNYLDYIYINLSYSEHLCLYSSLVSSDPANPLFIYSLTCKGTITTQKKVDCIFENVMILFDTPLYFTPGWKCGAMPLARLTYQGNSESNFSCSAKYTPLGIFPDSSLPSIKDIFGCVLVPKE